MGFPYAQVGMRILVSALARGLISAHQGNVSPAPNKKHPKKINRGTTAGKCQQSRGKQKSQRIKVENTKKPQSQREHKGKMTTRKQKSFKLRIHPTVQEIHMCFESAPLSKEHLPQNRMKIPLTFCRFQKVSLSYLSTCILFHLLLFSCRWSTIFRDFCSSNTSMQFKSFLRYSSSFL